MKEIVGYIYSNPISSIRHTIYKDGHKYYCENAIFKINSLPVEFINSSDLLHIVLNDSNIFFEYNNLFQQNSYIEYIEINHKKIKNDNYISFL
jgi:hypothetical protein